MRGHDTETMSRQQPRRYTSVMAERRDDPRYTAASQQPALFDSPDETNAQDAPLAHRMRPRSFDEIVGQDPLVATAAPLRLAVERGRLPSAVLWGPPGSGKTTLARVIAATGGARFVALSAVSAGVADLRRAVAEAAVRRRAGGRTILFIDEIHRFNKAQQDAILPYVEDGSVTLLGATTENPSFEVNAALLSRARVFVLRQLESADLELLLRRALTDPERGLGALGLSADDAALGLLAEAAAGDARGALNLLEFAATLAGEGGAINNEIVAQAAQNLAARYDRAGDEHYDTISAFIKSLRGSDPDAALYWLARMVEAGEDPLFIVRRMVILAAEDVGLADPQALQLAVATQQAVHFLGLPEAVIPLAEAAVYLARAPKSNASYAAYNAAREAARATRNAPVPLHLRNAATGLMKTLGYGEGYKYAHDFAGHVVQQQHLPDALTGQRFFTPSGQGADLP
jgi:putative ATPase